LSQLLLNRLGAVVQTLTELQAQLVDLVLHQQQRWSFGLFLQQRFDPAKKEPADPKQAKK